jgi:plasmid stabilization system protein ParE
MGRERRRRSHSIRNGKPLALDDREAIMEPIAQDNVNAAIHVDEERENEVDTVIDNPEPGSMGRVPETC